MKIAIIGYGLEGNAALEYWGSADNELTICDQNSTIEVPEGIAKHVGEGYLDNLSEFDLIVRSPNIHPRLLVDANGPLITEKMTSNTNEFLRACPTRNIIGITGTKGKGTTSTLVTKMLTAAGKTVHLGGNIGIPALDLLKENIQPDDWVVLELSNFQLIDVRRSPHIAACLLVMPEHLDWHTDFEEYKTAKQQLFRWQTEDDFAIYYPDNPASVQITGTTVATKIPYMHAPGAFVDGASIAIDGQVICEVSELKLLGEHNWQNACAAITIAWQITHDVAALHSVLKSFSGLPFRIEFRKEMNGIRYYNDSFATGPGSCIAAMRAIPEKKVMIMGGFDRGLDLHELVDAVVELSDTIRNILIIGASGDRLASELTANGYTNFQQSMATTMPEIVASAKALAEPGDAVVLSPGFASFDMFKNFEDRGQKFNAALDAL